MVRISYHPFFKLFKGEIQAKTACVISVHVHFQAFRRRFHFDKKTRQGLAQGLNEGIKALIITCRELGVSFDETANKVSIRFQLKDAEVQKNMSLYW